MTAQRDWRWRWYLRYVVGNPAVFTKITTADGSPWKMLKRSTNYYRFWRMKRYE